MEEEKPLSLEQIRAFLEASEEIRFEGRNRKEMYYWVKQTLIEQQYQVRGKTEKGLLRSYKAKMTGLSRAQVTRLIGQYVDTGEVEEREYRRRRFPSLYTRRDIELLAEVDEAHETLSGPATQKILYREL
jgi:transposase